MRSAAGTLKRITLELGGNDPAVVLPDVDARAIAPQLFWAAFQNNAQFCNSTKRLYVHEAVYNEVLAALVDQAASTVVGDGAEPRTQLGPIQNSAQFEKVSEYFDDCRQHATASAHRAPAATRSRREAVRTRAWCRSWPQSLGHFTPSGVGAAMWQSTRTHTFGNASVGC